MNQSIVFHLLLLLFLFCAIHLVNCKESSKSPTNTAPSSSIASSASNSKISNNNDDDEFEEFKPLILRRTKPVVNIFDQEDDEEEDISVPKILEPSNETKVETEAPVETPDELEIAEPAEDEDEDYDEEEGNESSSCDGRLSTFVRVFDGTAYLPPDYAELSEFVAKHGPYGHVKTINGTLEILERGLKFGESLRDNKDLADAGRYLGSVLADKMYEAQLSPNCTADLVAIGNGIRNLEKWAIQFPDSFGTLFLAGMFHGQFSSFGQFDQCIGIKSPAQENGRTVTGRYCTLHISAITPPIESYTPEDETIFRSHPLWTFIVDVLKRLNMEKYLHKDFALFITQATDKVDDNIYHNGICLPHSCSGEEIAKLINGFFYPLAKMSVRIPEKLCEPHPQLKVIKLDNYQKVAIITLTTIGGVVLLSTFIHLCIGGKVSSDTIDKSSDTKPPRPLFKHLLLSFSLIENTTHLFTIDPNRHASLDTLRVILSLLVFPINSLGLYLMYYPKMYRDGDGMTRQEMLGSNDHWMSSVPGLAFDGFVVIFGIMILFQQFNRLQHSHNEFSYLNYLLNRWFRYSPLIAGTVLLFYLLPLTGNGPMWFYNEQYVVAPCKKTSSLLSTFLYYSNWNDPIDGYVTRSTLNICNPPTWFISCFTQLYLFAPLLFLPLYYWPRFGLILSLVTLIFISPICILLPRLILGYPSFIEPTKFISFASAPQAVVHSQMSPLLYVTSLVVGLLTGYLIKSRPNLNLGGRFGEMFLWICSLVSVVFIFIWNKTFAIENIDLSTNSVMGFFAYYKLTWSIFLGYTIYLCCTGRGAFLAHLLHHPKLQPLARLSTCIYLLRALPNFYRKTSARQIAEMYYYRSFQNVVADFLLTALAALLLHLLFEAPILRLAKTLSMKGPVYGSFSDPTNSTKALDQKDEVEHQEKSSNVSNLNKNLTKII